MLEPFPTPDMVGSYDYSLVSLSALISLLSIYAALDFAGQPHLGSWLGPD